MPSTTFGEIVGLFDDFEMYLSTGPLRFAHMWISAGLDVALDEGSLQKYQDGMASEEAFAELVERAVYEKDRHTNMDY